MRDTGCGLSTGYAGDDDCLLPPEPDVGQQFHYGPTDYDDPEDVNRFVLAAGGEVLDCAYMNATNPEQVYYRKFKNSLRPSSHHMIVNELVNDIDDGFGPCNGLLEGGGSRLMGGTTVSRGVGEQDAPENAGLANRLGPNAQVEIQMHYFNTTEEPILREAWMNVFYKDASEVTELTEPIQGYGAVGMAVLPGTKAVWRSEMVAPENVRLVDIYSHYHVNTVRMSAWKVTAAGERTLLYESYDWSEPGVVELNSVTENSPPNPDTFTTGGESGIWMVDAGDRLEWECEIDNQLDVTIVWANRALDAEMCNLRGNYAPSWGGQWFAWQQGHECGPDNPCEY
jgi:hypothetical protein